MMLDVMDGKGPIYMQTAEAIQNIAEAQGRSQGAQEEAQGARERGLGRLPGHDHLQAILWAATNVQPEEKPSEIMAASPYFIGSHSGASGAWVSGPEDLQTDETKAEYFWGYTNMTTT
jgi:adenylylsulfate reductase subunit A